MTNPPHQLATSHALVPSLSTITSESEKEWILTRLRLAWERGASTRQNVDGLESHPVSLSRTVMSSMDSRDFLVSLKSDGVRYTLFMCMRDDETPLAIMIDRAHNMYETEVMAKQEYFEQETILEGELVANTGQSTAVLLFLVFDAVRVQGKMFTEEPFADRIAAVENLTLHSAEISQLNDLEEMEQRISETGSIVITLLEPRVLIKPKLFVCASHAGSLWDTRNDVDHRTDGLILHRANATYKSGTAENVTYKWKSHHTIDLEGIPPDLRSRSGPLDDSTFNGRKVVIAPSKIMPSCNTDVAEYHLDASVDGQVTLWAVRMRPDKRCPNSLKVIRATLQDSLDDVTPWDISTSSAKQGQ